jgi:predicted ATPase/DNA-binding CsgD family transcriptional regulator
MAQQLEFVGRVEALAALRERYFEARSGDGGMLVVYGEPGIGKSRLIEQFRETIAPGDGNLVGTAALDYAPSPFAPIVATIEAWRARRPQIFDRHVGLRDAVARITRADDAGIVPNAGERRRCFDGVALLFRLAAADAPTTLVVDDLHEADPATLALLYHILVATRGSAFLLLATSRPLDFAKPDVRAELLRLGRLANAATLSLGRLAADDVTSLVYAASAGRLNRLERERIALRADGNPLFLEELVRQALEDGSGGRTPASIAEMVVTRLLRMEPREREILSLAAAIGIEFSAAFLARCSSTATDVTYAALRGAYVAGLIAPTDDPDVFRFRHRLMRDAIYDEPLGIERRAVHRRVFGMLREEPPTAATIAALAFHASAAGDAAATVQFGELAGDQAAANLSFASAGDHYARAFAFAGDEAQSRIGMKLARALLAAGFLERAREVALGLLPLHRRRGDLPAIAETLEQLAEISALSSDQDGRVAYLEQAERALAETDDPLLVAKRTICSIERALAERDAARALAAIGTMVVRSDDKLAVALASATASARLLEGEYAAAIVAQIGAVRMARRTGDLAIAATAHHGLGFVAALGGELALGRRAFRRAAATSQARAALTDRAFNVALAAEMELLLGHTETARELVEGAISGAYMTDHRGATAIIGRVGLWIAHFQRDETFARRFVEVLDLEQIFAGPSDGYQQLAGAFARYLFERGRADKARDVLRRAIDKIRSVKYYSNADWSVCSMFEVAASGDAGDVEIARRPLREMASPFGPGFLRLFDAVVAERAGDRAGAHRHAAEALGPLRRYNLQYQLMCALSLAGRKTEALEIADRCRFTVAAHSLRDELTPRNRQGRASGDLTTRERDIARLVARGCTNREIADRLCIAEKTVESHLTSVLGKLGVRSRKEIDVAAFATSS